MGKDDKRTLTPRLRFPEFRKADGWICRPMGDLISLEYGESLPEKSRRSGSVPVMGSNGIVGYHEEALIKGPAIVIGRKGSVGQITWIDSDCFPIDTTFYVENKKPSNVSIHFLHRLLQVSGLESRRDPGAVPGLNRNGVHSLGTAIPEPAEQKKIADCLTSLDELIAGQGRKVEALKVHKKGLMQQLFPREGETLPRLRFPEFRDTQGWNKRRLGDFISERSEIADSSAPLYSLTIEDSVTAKTDRYERSFLVTNKDDAYKLVLPNDFAFNPMNLRFGAIGRHSGAEPVALSKYYNIFYCDKSVDPRFCEIYFRSDGMVAYYDVMATGTLIEKRRVHFDRFLNFGIPFPEIEEQRRIADCLSTLDVRTAAETEKLAALKTHKRGLMQQLFPSPEVD